MRLVIFCLLTPLLTISCAAQTVELIFVNADIRTFAAVRPRAESIAVTNSRIVSIGSNAEIRKLAGPSTKFVDLDGRVVIPGFIDSHVHFAAAGGQLVAVSIGPEDSAADITRKVAFNARFVPPGRWIVGGAWKATVAAPNASSINAATPDHPVVLYETSGKSAFANAVALKLAGLFGKIGEDGMIAGADMALVRRIAPSMALSDKTLLAETASNYAAAFGVTSVVDVSSDDLTEIYRSLSRAGKLKTRVYDCAALSDWKKLAERDRSLDNEFVRGGCLKGTADGDAELDDEMFSEIADADKAGLQVAVHAIGPRSVAQVNRVFARVAAKNGPRDRRFRIEHARSIPVSDFDLMTKNGIIASIQPALFADQSGRTIEPLASLLNAKITIALGSDTTMIPIDPLAGVAAAASNINPRENISVYQAVELYTKMAAFAEFSESSKGTLEPGKLADFVVLSHDIFALPESRIRETRVLKTYLGGNLVYAAEK